MSERSRPFLSDEIKLIYQCAVASILEFSLISFFNIPLISFLNMWVCFPLKSDANVRAKQTLPFR